MITTNIHPSEITQGAYAIPTPGRIEARSDLIVTLDNLDETREYTITIREETPYAQTRPGAASITCQGDRRTYPYTNTYGWEETFTIDPATPVILTLAGFKTWHTIAIAVHEHTTPHGTNLITLQALTPRPEYAGALLGRTTILGAFTLPSMQIRTPWTILGQSVLGASQLGTSYDPYAWQSITQAATSITYTRGLIYNGFTAQGDIGTLTATFYNALDPRASNLTRGTKVRLIDRTRRLPLFTGTIDKTTSTPDKDGTYTVQITALDAIAQLSSLTKYQETRTSPAHWTLAIEQLLNKTGIPYHLDYADYNNARPAIGSLVKEASYTQWLDIYSATARLHWYTDTTGTIRVRDTLPETPVASIVAHSATPASAGLPVTSIDAAVDTSQIASTLEIQNHTAIYDSEQGEWQDVTTTHRATAPTIEASYGTLTVQIETAGAGEDAIDRLAQEMCTDFTAHQSITSATCTLWDTYQRTHERLGAWLPLDLLNPITVTYRNGATITEYVTRIEHTITPHTWQATITLTEWRK